MGTFRVRIEVGDPSGQRFEAVEALVDTGSSNTSMPSSLLTRLGVHPYGCAEFELADGSVREFEMGYARVKVTGREGITQVVFAPEDLEPRLGHITLSELLLDVDAEREALVPVPGLLVTPRLISQTD